MTTSNLQNLIAAGADLLDDKAAAALSSGFSPGTLSVWRSTGPLQPSLFQRSGARCATAVLTSTHGWRRVYRESGATA
jgi:hypothetical protein